MDRKARKEVFRAGVQVFPTCDLILTDTRQEATSTGLWRPEIGLDYLSVSLLESNLFMILLRTGDDINRLSGRKNYSGEWDKFTVQLSMWITVGKKKNLAHCSNVTLLLLPERLQKFQRTKIFLHMRHNFRSLYLCKCHTTCLECPSLPLYAWRSFSFV